MMQERLLRALLVSDIALTILALPLSLIDDRYLPPALQAYVAAESESPMRLSEVVLLILGLPLLITLVLAWIGLFRSWKVAPALYLTVCVGTVLLLLVGGPTVQTAVGTALDTADSMISGLILGLVYFSALSNRFGRDATEGTGAVA